MPIQKVGVLLVDDEERILEGLRVHLEREFQVWTASSAREAMEVLNQRAVAVVVSDMCMPEKDGITFFEEVRQVHPETVRILLTGYASLETAITAINQGQVFRLLTKPCPVRQVVAMIRDGIEQYRLITADRDLVQGRAQEISEELIRIDRMAQLGTMASGVGHEFNNLAVVSRALVEELQEACEGGGPVTPEAVQDLEWLGQSIEKYGSQLLRMGQAQIDEPPGVLDFRALVQKTVESLSLLGKLRYIALQSDLPAHPVEVHGVEGALMQVVINLLNAALEMAERNPRRVFQLALSLQVMEEPGRLILAITGFGEGTKPRIPGELKAHDVATERGVHRDMSMMVSEQILHSHQGTLRWERPGEPESRLVVELPLYRLGVGELAEADTIAVEVENM